MAPFDQTEFLLEIRGDLKLLASMAKLFIATAEESLSEIEASIGDEKRFCRAIHQFRGSLGAVHAGVSYQLACEMENAGLANELDKLRDLFPALVAETHELVDALRPLAVWPPKMPDAHGTNQN